MVLYVTIQYYITSNCLSQVTNVLLLRQKNQAFVEMADMNSACALVELRQTQLKYGHVQLVINMRCVCAIEIKLSTFNFQSTKNLKLLL